ncbi:MAG: Holliday junction resolvase RuvX [Proteobacteria bacterium]|nr:Holliday junction resolvase RuvX [Pseudomonadota bacterium]
MNNQTLLCFDYGEKRIGTAVGQTITATATALETIKVINTKPDWEIINRLISEWEPNILIVGHPFTLDGARQKMTDAAERFSRQLKGRFKIPVELIEEQLSSYEARRELESTRDLDPVAARLILETWLRENIEKCAANNVTNEG